MNRLSKSITHFNFMSPQCNGMMVFISVCISLIVFIPTNLIGNNKQKKYTNYKIADSLLKEAWEKKFPVPYSRIIKKDLSGKGVVSQTKKGKNAYVYTFLVFVPRYQLDAENNLVPKENLGKEVFVKLFYFPENEEEPYEIFLGDFDEKWIYLKKYQTG